MRSSFYLSWPDLGGSQTLYELDVEIVVLASFFEVGIVTDVFKAEIFVKIKLNYAPHYFDAGRDRV